MKRTSSAAGLVLLLGCQKEPQAAHAPESPHPSRATSQAQALDAGPAPLILLQSEVRDADVKSSEYVSGELICPRIITLRPLPEPMCLRVWSNPKGAMMLGLGGTDVVCGTQGESLTVQCKNAGNVVYVVGALIR